MTNDKGEAESILGRPPLGKMKGFGGGNFSTARGIQMRGVAMISKMVSAVLVAALLHGSIAAQDQPQLPQQTIAKMQEVLHKAQEEDRAVKVTLKKAIDNQKKFSGKVSDISDTGFVVTDRKSGATKKVAYEDVQKVNQTGMSRGAKIGIWVAVGIAVLAVVAVVATKPWRSE